MRQIKKVFRYDSETGVFYNRESNNPVYNTDSKGEFIIWLSGNSYRACDAAWRYVTGSWPKRPVAHRDGVMNHNWLSNLYIPAKIRKDNRSMIPGVSRDKRDKKWRAQIWTNRKMKNLGSYEDFDNAVMARFKGEQEHGFKPDTPAHNYIKSMFL